LDLKTNIDQELWKIIEKNYCNEIYSSSILDAMHYLTETIRNKTGLESDGVSLIGQAFGGDNPKIQINKQQTESEKNFHKGIQDILKGLYTGIRNPRSHEKYIDTKVDTDSIIFFVNYLLNIIDKSKLSFEETAFLKRVFDEHYVRTKDYSDLLVKEIPKRQNVNIAISIILRRKDGDIDNLNSFLTSLFDQLEDGEVSQVYKVISEELKYTSSDEDIRTILHICPVKYWSRIDKAVKIRIENILLESVKAGKYDDEKGKCRFGALGTWIEYEHLLNFENSDNLNYLFINKIEKGDAQEVLYIDKFFWDKICKLNHDSINFWLSNYFKTGLQNKNEIIVKKMHDIIRFDENHPWWKVFEEELKDYPEIIFEGDELPFW